MSEWDGKMEKRSCCCDKTQWTTVEPQKQECGGERQALISKMLGTMQKDISRKTKGKFTQKSPLCCSKPIRPLFNLGTWRYFWWNL